MLKKIMNYLKELFRGERSFWEVFLIWGVGIICLGSFLSYLLIKIDNISNFFGYVGQTIGLFLLLFYSLILLYFLITNFIKNFKKNNFVLIILKIFVMLSISSIQIFFYYLYWSLKDGR